MNDESPQNDDWKLVPMEDFLSNNEKDKFKWDDYLKSLAEMLPNWEYKPTGLRHVCLPLQDMRSRFPMVWRENLGSSRKAMVWECVAPPAIYEMCKHRFAVKVLSCPAFERPVTEALEEVRNMEDIEHCHIVSYVASYESAEKLGIIMYPPAKCNLDEYMRPVSQELAEISQVESGMPRACLSPESRQKIKHLYRFFGCLSEAVRYLQATAVGIKHKDIKPANIVVDHFNSPLLTDFGIAHRYASPEEVDTSGYTEKTKKYACPEALDEENRNYSADIFSLGCVFLEIVTISLEVPLDDLYSHLTDAGNDTIYAMTLSKIPGWMDVLRAKHGSNNDADGKEVDAERQEMITSLINILPVIEDMMAKERERRPSAQFLCEKFGAMYSKPCRSCAWRPREQKTPTLNQSPPVPSPNAGPAESGETQDKIQPITNSREKEKPDKRRSRSQKIHAKVIFYDPLNTKATIERFENIKRFKTTRVRFKPFRRFVKVKIAGQEHSVIDLKKLGWRIFLRCFIGDISYIHVLGEIKESSARTDRSGPG